MVDRNKEGLLTSDVAPDGTAPTKGLIDHIRALDARLQALEDKLFPPVADGSGTERYDNWTQHSDGTDYPGSYGVGPELKPFEPLPESAPEAEIPPAPEA